MAQYIDKAAVVAEIERRMQELHPTNTHQMQVGEKMDRDVLMWLNALTWVKNSLNTLEAKEVDLEKEIIDYIGDEDTCKNGKWNWYECNNMIRHFFELGVSINSKLSDVINLEEEIKKYLDEQPVITKSKGINYKLVPSAEVIAKHFFELGIKVQNNEIL